MGSLQLEFCGARAELRSDSDALLAVLAHLYRPFVCGAIDFAQPSASETGPCEARLAGEVHRFASVADAAYELDQRIEPLLLAPLADRLRIHAAVVESATHTILLVGPSGSGKTTLALELVRRGLRYLSDEFAIVDRNATRIQPFPRAAIRKADGPHPDGARVAFLDDWGFRDYVLPDLRADLEPRPLLPRWIVFPTHGHESTPRARPLEPGESCARFLSQIFDFEGAEGERWPALANLVAGSRACALEFRDASVDVDLALAALGTDASSR